jgi:tRNA G18 (ribose-2'-O)-methylase SpoU
MSNHREQTRRQRYNNKRQVAQTFPISIATVNFMFDENLGFVVRSAACFGANTVHVIGSMPQTSILRSKSGSIDEFINIIQHNNPTDFLDWCRANNTQIVSAEINEGAIEINDYQPNFSSPICIVVGHEETGVPAEISASGDNVFIEMPGVGFCLNTSQTANIMLYDFVNKFRRCSVLTAA